MIPKKVLEKFSECLLGFNAIACSYNYECMRVSKTIEKKTSYRAKNWQNTCTSQLLNDKIQW